VRVLLIGGNDVAGPFGATLAQLFTAAGASVDVVASAGARTADYLPDGRFASQVPSRVNTPLGFDMAVLALGSIDTDPPAIVADRLRAIATSLPTSVVWCVGSPTSTALYNESHKRFGARFIDSRAGAQSPAAWASLVFDRIKRVMAVSEQLREAADKNPLKPWMIVAGVALVWWAFGGTRK
jgi:hypothetical protein